MARIDEKNLASVKKTVSTAGPTGGILSAFDIAQSKKFVQNVGGKKAADAQVGALMGINKTAAAPAKGKGGKLTKVSTPVKAGATLKNALKQGDQSSATQVMKNKLTVKPTNAAPAKTEELKISTFKLPAVFEVAGNTYNREDVLDAVKKAKSTYGANSNKYKSLLSSLSIREQGGQLLFSGREFKKPDLRKDAGKSYVDTAQTVLGNIPNTQRMSPSPYGRLASLEDSNKYSDRETVDLLKQFGVRPDRNLGKDPKATNR